MGKLGYIGSGVVLGEGEEEVERWVQVLDLGLCSGLD